jgi:cytochrome c oxidase subunit 3
MEEYSVRTFTFADRVFGRIFFIATGFHGLHVFLGSILLSISGFRLFFFHFSSKHHVGYEAAI